MIVAIIGVNEIGDLIKPDYVTAGFTKLLKEHGMRQIRYHDLRHSCASLLLANGVPMKQIQNGLDTAIFLPRQIFTPIWTTTLRFLLPMP